MNDAGGIRVRGSTYGGRVGALQAQVIDELGYDPDDGRAQLSTLDLRADGGDVPVGSIVAARRGAEPVAVARLESGRLVVIADHCPHDGGRISDGFVEGDRVVCARHGWQFDPMPHSLAASASPPSRSGAVEPCWATCIRAR